MQPSSCFPLKYESYIDLTTQHHHHNNNSSSSNNNNNNNKEADKFIIFDIV
jgi:hypothetical protein